MVSSGIVNKTRTWLRKMSHSMHHSKCISGTSHFFRVSTWGIGNQWDSGDLAKHHNHIGLNDQVVHWVVQKAQGAWMAQLAAAFHHTPDGKQFELN